MSRLENVYVEFIFEELMQSDHLSSDYGCLSIENIVKAFLDPHLAIVISYRVNNLYERLFVYQCVHWDFSDEAIDQNLRALCQFDGFLTIVIS